jgi:hypothetical protein
MAASVVHMTNKGATLFDFMANNADLIAQFDSAFDDVKDDLFFTTWAGPCFDDDPEAMHMQFQRRCDDDDDCIHDGMRMCAFAGRLAGHVALSQNKSIEEALAAAKARFAARFHEWVEEGLAEAEARFAARFHELVKGGL